MIHGFSPVYRTGAYHLASKFEFIKQIRLASSDIFIIEQKFLWIYFFLQILERNKP